MTNAEMFQDVFGCFPYLPCEDGYYIDAKLQDRQWWDMPFQRDISTSILINGMEMPDAFFHCILSFMYFNGTENVLRCNVLKKLVSDDGSKDPDCPLIEVPPRG